MLSFEKHERRNHHTKTLIVPFVVGIVVVAIRTTHVPLIIVVRAATQHARDVTSQPRQFALAISIIRYNMSLRGALVLAEAVSSYQEIAYSKEYDVGGKSKNPPRKDMTSNLSGNQIASHLFTP